MLYIHMYNCFIYMSMSMSLYMYGGLVAKLCLVLVTP